MPTTQQLQQAEDCSATYVLVSNYFLNHLKDEWSEPIQVRVEGREGDVVRLVVRLVTP